MFRGNFRIVLILIAVIAAGYYLYPTYQWYKLPAEEQELARIVSLPRESLTGEQLQMVDNLTEAEREKLDDLKREVNTHRVLGYTRRDQLVYEIIDEYLAEEQTRIGQEGFVNLTGLRAETKERVKEIWRNVSLGIGDGT